MRLFTTAAMLLALGLFFDLDAVEFQPGPARAANLIVTNAEVTTLDPEQPIASAVAVRDGIFVAVGDEHTVAAYRGSGTKVIDAQGRRLIPGLNDSHTHAVRAGRFYSLELRWDGVLTLRRGLEMIADQATRTPEGEWVRVIGAWSPFQFEERRMPTIVELNKAAPNTPVFVLYLYSSGFLNAAGVKALGLTEDTPAPKGSRYEFVDGGAILHAEPNPMILYRTVGALPRLDAEVKALGSRHYYRELSRLGITSVIDAGGGGHNFPTDYDGTDVLAKQGTLPVRVSYYLFPQRPGQETGDFRAWIEANKTGQNFHIHLQSGYRNLRVAVNFWYGPPVTSKISSRLVQNCAQVGVPR